METPKKKLFLLDAYALIYRAFFAMSKNPRMNSKGLNTSAVMETYPYRRGLRRGRHRTAASRIQRIQGQPREDARRPARLHTLYN